MNKPERIRTPWGKIYGIVKSMHVAVKDHTHEVPGRVVVTMSTGVHSTHSFKNPFDANTAWRYMIDHLAGNLLGEIYGDFREALYEAYRELIKLDPRDPECESRQRVIEKLQDIMHALELRPDLHDFQKAEEQLVRICERNRGKR